MRFQVEWFFDVEWSNSLTVLVCCLETYENLWFLGGRRVDNGDCLASLLENPRTPMVLRDRRVENGDCIVFLVKHL